MKKENIQQCRGVGVVTHVVEEEVLDGREEVVIGKDVVGIGGGVCDEASSRADSTPQKPYRPSPVQNSKRQDSGGLLLRLAVHATRRDGEELLTAQCSGTWRRWF